MLKEFGPELIFVSCGFDSAKGDPIGKLCLTQNGYEYMTNELKKLNKNMFVVLEGGYNLDTISWASESVAKALSSS